MRYPLFLPALAAATLVMFASSSRAAPTLRARRAVVEKDIPRKEPIDRMLMHVDDAFCLAVPPDVEDVLAGLEASATRHVTAAAAAALNGARLTYGQTAVALDRILALNANASNVIPVRLLGALPAVDIVGGLSALDGHRAALLAQAGRLLPSQRLALFLTFVRGDGDGARLNASATDELFGHLDAFPIGVAELTRFVAPHNFHPEDGHGAFEDRFVQAEPDVKLAVAAAMPMSLVSRDESPLRNVFRRPRFCSVSAGWRSTTARRTRTCATSFPASGAPTSMPWTSTPPWTRLSTTTSTSPPAAATTSGASPARSCTASSPSCATTT